MNNMKQDEIYKTMKNSGALNIAVGIVVSAIGIASGTVLIVTGAKLLLRRHFVGI